MAKSVHQDQRYLLALVNNDAGLINEIYKKCAGKVKSFVVFNNGTADDAEDIFQEALVDIYNQAKYKDLQLTCPFEPFLLLVCKRKWLNALKKKSVLQVTNSEDDLLLVGEDTFKQAEQLEEQQAQADLFLKAFEKLGDRCKEIIKWSMQGDAQEKVAEALGVTYGYLRKKKSECMASLIKLVQVNN
ncbi:sigma-70 family RNA polymerase sigma factor [Pedobacter polaris]|uniref:Sigma-70 family RNA polymerase sigma factor n=1 Tax=Pedobacter polaris TaxID=2571273 RepID=A0A4U1CLR6_9SPHI|nr:sigma-70 family RNA polymerase sigma factor [Pedobacter polaris]TKC08237.1 sigma-70 family RNA polymerase sigma factor [Pedobacter polaris]